MVTFTGDANCLSKYQRGLLWDGRNKHADMQSLHDGSFPNGILSPGDPHAAASIMDLGGTWNHGSNLARYSRPSHVSPRGAGQSTVASTRRGGAGPPPTLQPSPLQSSGPMPSACQAWLPTPGSLTSQSIAALPSMDNFPPFSSSGPLPPPSAMPSQRCCGSFDRELFQTASSFTDVLDGLEDTWSQWAANMGSFPAEQEQRCQAAAVQAPMDSSRSNISRRLLVEQDIKQLLQGGAQPRPCLPVYPTRDAMPCTPRQTQATQMVPAATLMPPSGLPHGMLREGEYGTPELHQSRNVLSRALQDSQSSATRSIGLATRSIGLAVKRPQTLFCYKAAISKRTNGLSMRVAAALLQLAWTAWVCELRRTGLVRLSILQAAALLRPILARWCRHVREILPLRLVVEFRPLRRAFEVWRRCTSLAAFSKVSDAAPAQPPAPTFGKGNCGVHTFPEAARNNGQLDTSDSCHAVRSTMHQSKGFRDGACARQQSAGRRGSAFHALLRKGVAGRGCRCCWRLWRREARLQSRLRAAGREIARLHAHVTTRRCLHVWRVAVVASKSAAARKCNVRVDADISGSEKGCTVPIRQISDRAMGALEAFVQSRLCLADLRAILQAWVASVRDARMAAHVADLERSVERHSAMRRHAVWLLANAAPGTSIEALLAKSAQSATSSGLSGEEH